MKRKCLGWILGIICDLTHDLDLGCFKVKFRNSCISGIVGLIDVKWKGSEWIGYLANYMTLLFDHTHDIDLGVSRSESEIAFIKNGMTDWHGTKRMWVIHSWAWYWLSVTVVGWVEVPDSDQGDFRHRRAIDISSSVCIQCDNWF